MRANTLKMLMLFLVTVTASAVADVRCALDLGSGTIKIQVAEVDPNLQKISKILYPKTKQDQDDVAVNLLKAMEANNGTIPAEAIEAAVTGIELLKAKSGYKGTCRAVATEVYRAARNADVVIRRLESGAKIKIKIISRKEEAQLGFIGTMAKLPAEAASVEDVVVWDIGNGSQEFSAWDSARKELIWDSSDVGSLDFQRMVAGAKGLKAEASPNPFSDKDVERAVALSEKEAKNIGKAIRARLANPKVKVYGIGGVHNKSIKPQLKAGSESYDAAALNEVLAARVGQDDDAIEKALKIPAKSVFTPSQVSNVALVSGAMQELKIERVNILRVNLTDGALVFSEIWK